jgi:hypothetical protein
MCTKLTLDRIENRRAHTLEGRGARERRIEGGRDSTARSPSHLPSLAGAVWEGPYWLNIVSVHGFEHWVADQTVIGECSPDSVKRRQADGQNLVHGFPPQAGCTDLPSGNSKDGIQSGCSVCDQIVHWLSRGAVELAKTERREPSVESFKKRRIQRYQYSQRINGE